jgi:plasmid stabilization system protein ParE
VRLRYAPRARTDIAEIYEHIAQYSPRAATSVTAQIRATSQLLAEYPGLGRVTDIPVFECFRWLTIHTSSTTAFEATIWSSFTFDMRAEMRQRKLMDDC